MRYTTCGIIIRRVPLSPKWATHGPGSDFAILSATMYTISLALCLLHADGDSTAAGRMNPHTSNALSIAARRTPPTQSARRGELLQPWWAHVPVGIYNTPKRHEIMCGHLYTRTDAIIHVDGHNIHRQSHRTCISCSVRPQLVVLARLDAA